MHSQYRKYKENQRFLTDRWNRARPKMLWGAARRLGPLLGLAVEGCKKTSFLVFCIFCQISPSVWGPEFRVWGALQSKPMWRRLQLPLNHPTRPSSHHIRIWIAPHRTRLFLTWPPRMVRLYVCMSSRASACMIVYVCVWLCLYACELM